MRKIAALSAGAVLAGCLHLAEDPWRQTGPVIGAPASKGKADLAAAWRGEADPWKGAEARPGNVIGGESAFERGEGKAAAAKAASLDAGGGGGIEREVRVLSARVDRLERIVEPGTGAARQAPVAGSPRAVEVYKVHPDGQIAWIALGSRGGMKEGQTLEVMRGGRAVAQARVSRVWPDVSELTVLWANGKLQRGDAVAVR